MFSEVQKALGVCVRPRAGRVAKVPRIVDGPVIHTVRAESEPEKVLFHILTERSPSALAFSVQCRINKGWEPVGGPFSYVSPSELRLVCQAMRLSVAGDAPAQVPAPAAP